MAQDWFVVRDGKETGPFTAPQLKDMTTTGRLIPDDLVRRADMQAPRKASTIKGLFAATASASTKPPPPSVSETAPPPATQKKGVPSKKKLIVLSAVGGACLLLCCGGFGLVGMFGMKMQDTTRKQLAEADALWDKGDKTGAVGKYRDIFNDHRATFLKDEDRPRVYGRVIDADVESGNTDSAKKLLADAKKNGVTPSVSRPEASRLLATEEARARGEVLTAEFYPYKKGTVQRSMASVLFNFKNEAGKPTEGEMRSRREYTHEGDGVIVQRKLDHFTVPGYSKLPLGNPVRHLYREKDGFIEIGDTGEFVKETTWTPIIKLGALAGDEWERETVPGTITEHYKLARFAQQEVEFSDKSKRKIVVAFVEMRMTAKVGDGKTMEMGQDIQLGQGVGLVHRLAWRIEDGQRKNSWYEHFTPEKK
jgi:hypothetical protein